MTRTHLKTIAVVTGHDQPKLSKGQQAFNKLIKQIEKKRVQLADWETAIPLYQQKYVSELLPLVKDLMDISSVRLIFKQIHLVTEVRCDDSVVIKLQGA